MKIFFPILTIIISIVAFIYAINPFYKDTLLLKSEIVIYNQALDNSKLLQQTEDKLLNTYNSIRESDRDRLNRLLPDSVNNIQFILEIERIANIHNIPIKDIKFDQVRPLSAGGVVSSGVKKDTRPYGVFPIQFSAEGNYNDFTLFLKDLESNLRIADVKSISFNVPAPVPTTGVGAGAITVDPNIYKYSIKLETYWLK